MMGCVVSTIEGNDFLAVVEAGVEGGVGAETGAGAEAWAGEVASSISEVLVSSIFSMYFIMTSICLLINIFAMEHFCKVFRTFSISLSFVRVLKLKVVEGKSAYSCAKV